MTNSTVYVEKQKAALSYLLGPITGIFFLLREKENSYIRFHAMQSTLVIGTILLVNMVLGIVPILGPIIVILLSLPISGVTLVLILFLMYKAYIGEKFKLPYFGDLAEKQLANLSK